MPYWRHQLNKTIKSSDISKKVWKRIYELRIDRNLSQGQVCKKIWVSPSVFSNLETGKYNPTLDMLMKIAQEFDIEIKDLFE